MTDAELDLWGAYLADPSQWMTEVLGVESLENYHADIASSIVEFDRVAVKACHSVGKTWLMARISLWFFSMFENSIVITTAPTYRQVKALLWGEIKSAYKNSNAPLGGRMLDTELKLDEKHYMLGFSPQSSANKNKEQQGSSFQGFHSDNVLVIFDEAVGVLPDVWAMAEGLLTSGSTVKFVAIANPTTKNCEFFNCFSKPEFKKATITCFDSPNLKANGFTDKDSLQLEIDRLMVLDDESRMAEIQAYEKPVPYLLTAQFVVPYVIRLGFEHPLVLSKVFGEFPKDEDNVLVQYEDVATAVNRTLELDPTDVRFIGVDVARFGADKTVITTLNGFKHTSTEVLTKRDLTHVTGAVVNKILEHPCDTMVVIDSTGLGAGVYDNLVENQREKTIPRNVQLVEAHFGASAALAEAMNYDKEQDKARYVNLKAKMFDQLATDLRNKIDLMDEAIYFEELPSVQYKFDSKGRIVIESKDDYKSRTSRPSPDFCDSLALANYGRYANVGHGRFNGKDEQGLLVKQKKRKPRKSGIKVKEY